VEQEMLTLLEHRRSPLVISGVPVNSKLKDKQYNGQKEKDKQQATKHYTAHVLIITKGVIRISKSKKERQDNGETKMDKRANNDLQNINTVVSCSNIHVILLL
jgi:hypothetical protein